MIIGIIGNGFVGKATNQLKCNDIEILAYDINPDFCVPNGLTITDLNACEIIFISVPTPMSLDGSCHIGIIQSVLKDLENIGYNGFIVLRSTVPTGTSDNLKCYFMPEFLTEKNYVYDFTNNKDWIFGLLGLDKERDTQFETTIQNLFNLALLNEQIKYNNLHFISNKEAEMVKLFRNCFLATKVSFCNEMFEFCEKTGINYENVRKIAANDDRILHSHTTVPGHDGKKGFGGTCFPKDTASLKYEMNKCGMKPYIMEAIIERNENVDRPEKDWANDKGRSVVDNNINISINNNTSIYKVMKTTEPFFDKNVILFMSDNIKQEFNKPDYIKRVFDYNSPPDTFNQIAYFKTFKDKKNYKIYYRTGDTPNELINANTGSGLQPYERVSLMQSDDGLNFENKELTEPFEQLSLAHNFFPFYDELRDKYIGISGTGCYGDGIWLFESTEGIAWEKLDKIVNANMILQYSGHNNHYDSHNSIVYNKYDKHYYLFIRHNCSRRSRWVQMTKTTDFKTFTPMKEITVSNYDDNLLIYNFNVFMYPNSYYLIAMPCSGLASNYNIKTSKYLLYSLDGEHWHGVHSNLFSSEYRQMICNGMVSSTNDKQYYLYAHENINSLHTWLDCYAIDKDRMSVLMCTGAGNIKTKLINLANNNITINYKTVEGGSITIQIKDKNTETVVLESNKVEGDELNEKISWTNNIDLVEDDYYIEFNMNNIKI